MLLGGIDDTISKTATLVPAMWDTEDVHIFRPLAFTTASVVKIATEPLNPCLLYTSPSPRDRQKSRMPSSA